MQTLDADQGSLVRSHSSSDRLERSLRQRSVYAVRVTYERQAEMDLSLLTLTWRRFCAFRAECGSEIMLLRARCLASLSCQVQAAAMTDREATTDFSHCYACSMLSPHCRET